MDGLIRTLKDRRLALVEELELVDRLLELHERREELEPVRPGVASVQESRDGEPVDIDRRNGGRPSPIDVRPFTRTATGMLAVLDASEAYLRRKGSRAESSEIYRALVSQGLLEEGSRNNVTSYLGRAKRTFDNVRGEGYGLREWKVAEKAR